MMNWTIDPAATGKWVEQIADETVFTVPESGILKH